MSVILIKDHDESIYHYVQKEPYKYKKSPRYKSIHTERVKCEAKKVKDDHRTMGYANYPLLPPDKFLKKRTGYIYKTKPDICAEPKCLTKLSKKPPIPSHKISKKQVEEKSKQNQPAATSIKKEEQDVKLPEKAKLCKCTNRCCCPNKYADKCRGESNIPKKQNETSVVQESKQETPAKKQNTKFDPNNKIIRNIYSAIKTKPKEPVPKYVDTRYGTKHDLVLSGLEPQYVLSKKFGKTPKYVLKLMSEQQKQQQMEKDKTNVQIQPICRYISKEEREELLQGLKANWAELQKQYQGLPILTDTIPKMQRKIKLEAELAELEKDIILIERHPYIYIYNDGDDYENKK